MKTEQNRGALLRAARRLLSDANTFIETAGYLTRMAGGGEEELINISNAFLHCRRAIGVVSEAADLFPRVDEVPAPAPKTEARAS